MRWGAAVVCVLIAGGLVALRLVRDGPARHAAIEKRTAVALQQAGVPAARYSPAHPAPAWSGPLPYPLLVADAGNHRLVEVTPAGQVVWQVATKLAGVALQPSGVAFARGGQDVLLTAEHQDVVALMGYAARTIDWSFGVPGHAGGGSGHLDYPGDPATLGNGDVALADIRNCREVFLTPAGRWQGSWGHPQSTFCQTRLSAGLFGYPDGSQPQPDGDLLLTFSSGDRIALFSAQGRPLWSVPAPTLYGGFAAGGVLTAGEDIVVCGYGRPGAVVGFNPRTGAVLWHYFVASGSGALADPTAAVPLPNGDVAVVDSGNNRVVVIDPRTVRIVWSYSKGLRDPEGIALDVYRDWQGWPALPAGAG